MRIDEDYLKEIGIRPNKEYLKKTTLLEDLNIYKGWFIGYLGNMGNAPIGINVGYISNSIGIYFYYVTAAKDFTDENLYENISESKARYDFGDRQTDEDNIYHGYSLGTVVTVYRMIKIYGGLTLYKQSQYLKFYDEFQILGDNGSYWVKSAKENEIFSFNLGTFLFFTDEWYFQLGGSFNPSGLELGIGKTF